MNVAWAEGSTLPLTSWIDGTRIYVSATPLPLNADQAEAAGLRLIEQAQALRAGDPHAPAVARMNEWLARSTRAACLICKVPLTQHGICAGCFETGRRLNEGCDDCCVTPPCICEISLGTTYPMSRAEQLAEAMAGRD